MFWLIPSFSDIILLGTLLVNVGAVLNFKFKKPSVDQTQFGLNAQVQQTPTGRLLVILQNLKFLRIFIAVWNVFVMFLMVVFFG